MERLEFEELMRAADLEVNFAELGREVHRRWTSEADQEELPKQDVMRGYVSKLANGDATWWENHPDALRHLADILAVPEARIVGHVHRPARHVRFPEFPEMRPFDPDTEALPPGYEFAKTGGDAPEPLERIFENWKREAPLWLHVPTGCKPGLVARWIAHNARAELLSVGDIEDITQEVLSETLTIVTVERAAPSEYTNAESHLLAQPLVVVAPYPCPYKVNRPLAIWTGRRSWSQPGISSEVEDGWYSYAWRTSDGWRRQFLKWVEGRLKHSLFTEEGVTPWLEEKDPRGTIFGTPSSLLSLSAYVDAQPKGERALHQEDAGDVAAWWLSRSAPDADVSEVRREWLRGYGAQTLEHLIGTVFDNLSYELGAEIALEDWLDMVPESLCSGRLSDDRAREVKTKIAQAESDEDATKVLAEIGSMRPRDVLDHLTGAGLLREQRRGFYRLEPEWLRVWLERRLVTERLNKSTRIWGTRCLEAKRSERVDECLDEATSSALVELAMRAADEFDLGNVESVARVEAVFAACGRRLMLDAESFEDSKDVLRSLLECQLELLERDCLPKKGPLTRDVLTRFGDYEIGWQLGCWAWSVHFSAPDGRSDLLQSASALFPVWAQPEVDRELELNFRGTTEVQWTDEWVEALDTVVERVWHSFDQPELGDDIPFIFLPTVLLGVSRGDLDVSPAKRFLPRQELGEAFVQVFEDEQLSEAEQERLARFLLDCVAQTRSRLKFSRVMTDLGRLGAWCIERMPAERFESLLERQGFKVTVGDFSYVPVNFRPIIYDWVIEHPEEFDSHEFFSSLQPETIDVDGLTRIANEFGHRARDAVRMVWSLNPERAEVEARRTLAGDNSEWVGCSPPQQRRALLEIVREVGQETQIEPWVRRWVRRQIPEGGSDSQFAFDTYREVWPDKFQATA